MNTVIDFIKLSWHMIYDLCDLLLFGHIDELAMSSENLVNKTKTYNNVFNICSESYNNICYEIGWKYCEIITIINTFYYKTIIPVFHEYTNYYFRNEVIVIKDGDEVMYFKNIDDLKEYTEPIVFDFIIHTNYELNDSKKNYTAICDDKNIQSNNILENKCNINFIIFQLIFNGTTYDINLKEPRNFLVKNNILRHSFFKWYMKKTYNIYLSQSFQVNYMTQDMTLGNLHSPFFIKFNIDGVTSFMTGNPNLSVNIPKHIDVTNKINLDTTITNNLANENDIFDSTKDIEYRAGTNDRFVENVITSITQHEKLKCL